MQRSADLEARSTAAASNPQSRWLIVSSLVLMVVGLAQIAGTYAVFSHVWDEPAHIASGMQLLDLGEYNYELQHPPLARLAAAIGPYLAGSRSFADRNMWNEGLRLLYNSVSYERTLTLARLEMLPFFVLLVALTWWWANRIFGVVTATLTSLFLVTQPTVLAYAGLATTDLPAVAMSIWSLDQRFRSIATPRSPYTSGCSPFDRSRSLETLV